MRMFLRRGGAPPANASLEIGSRWPLDLPGSLNVTDVAGLADGGDLADAAAWYLGIQAGVFYEQPIAHPHRVQVGDTLDPPVADGDVSLTRPPHDGNFVVRRNRSSTFAAYVVWDFAFADFAAAGCGPRAGACGLRTLGGAFAGGRRSAISASATSRLVNATLLRGGRSNDAGAIWQREMLPLDAGFVTTFTFRVTDRSLCADEACTVRIGGGGFGLVIQSAADGAGALGCPGDGYGLWRRPGCNQCVAPAFVLRLDTYAELRWDANASVLNWDHHNQLRMHAVQCRPDAATTSIEPLQAIDLGPAITIDDGRYHAVEVRYLAHTLTVRIDGKLVLFAELELTRVSEGAEATTEEEAAAYAALDDASGTRDQLQSTDVRVTSLPPVQGGESRRLMRVGVLDHRGNGRLGLVGASGALGHEQYEIGSWTFERVVKMPEQDEPPLNEAEAARAAALAAEAAETLAIRRAYDALENDLDGSGSGDAGSGSGDSGSGSGDWSSGSGDAGSGSGSGEGGSGTGASA
jgi:uncharacterized membrane protein YgcG